MFNVNKELGREWIINKKNVKTEREEARTSS